MAPSELAMASGVIQVTNAAIRPVSVSSLSTARARSSTADSYPLSGSIHEVRVLASRMALRR